ncbi:tRNA (adenosine(37)-N6)-threonylcarbamoyltransferase complex dimerization subunit type 1 TsaB [bacterium]|nr:tRNA (adenosine(37)-N6)-threonylcarbamoyltransferase complex dimerization subunit type 1 TsaB [bacterium]
MSSLTLAVDSSSENLFVALLDEQKALVDLRLALSQPHSLNLMTAIDWILEQASVKSSQIEKLVVGCGPGSFSGLRIGMASMQGLAQALNRPLYTFISHDLVALKFAHQTGNLAVLTDARRQQLYWSAYISDGNNLTRFTPCRVDDPQILAEQLPESDMLLVGSGVEVYRAELVQLLPDATLLGMPYSQPDLTLLLKMPLVDSQDESLVGLKLAGKSLEPLYVRPSDAEINRQKKLKELADG